MYLYIYGALWGRRDPIYGALWVPSRLTRDSRNRRLTRDSVIVVSLVIPVFPAHFFVNKFHKNRKNRFFGLPGPKYNFEIFMLFLLSLIHI